MGPGATVGRWLYDQGITAADIHVRRYRHRRTGRYFDIVATLETAGSGHQVAHRWETSVWNTNTGRIGYPSSARPVVAIGHDIGPDENGHIAINYAGRSVHYYDPAVLRAAGHGQPGTTTYTASLVADDTIGIAVVTGGRGPEGIAMGIRRPS
jgi:cellulase/cellobiase CelA1